MFFFAKRARLSNRPTCGVALLLTYEVAFWPLFAVFRAGYVSTAIADKRLRAVKLECGRHVFTLVSAKGWGIVAEPRTRYAFGRDSRMLAGSHFCIIKILVMPESH